MLQTQLVRQLPQAAKGIGTLPEHFAALPAHRVDDEVGVDVLRVQVGGDQHLAVRPGPCRELFRQLVGLFPGDHLVRRKGLDVVVEPDGAVLASEPVIANEAPDDDAIEALRKAADALIS